MPTFDYLISNSLFCWADFVERQHRNQASICTCDVLHKIVTVCRSRPPAVKIPIISIDTRYLFHLPYIYIPCDEGKILKLPLTVEFRANVES